MKSGLGKEGGPWPVHFASSEASAASLLVEFWGNVRNQFLRDTFGFPFCFETVALPLVEMDEVAKRDGIGRIAVDESVADELLDEHSS